MKLTYNMTPAETPRAPARVRRDANLTSDGKKTTKAPSAVAAPAPITKAKATPTLGSWTTIAGERGVYLLVV